ncbi:MAG: metal-dependent transcriptional regulator [Bacillota bacterium]|nr:metal-dependent transcriptional regulator [Bacillota bacterium]
MNRSEEDYIKALYSLEETIPEGKAVSNSRLTERLGHTAQTVNEMIRRLERKGLVIYRPYRGSRLTDLGRAEAVRMTRVHRLWELFLVQHLRYSWDDVHEEAERLEHATSEHLAQALYRFLGEPSTCPHGQEIPVFAEEMSSLPSKKQSRRTRTKNESDK